MTISQNRFNVPFIVLKLQKILLIIRKRELGRRNFFCKLPELHFFTNM